VADLTYPTDEDIATESATAEKVQYEMLCREVDARLDRVKAELMNPVSPARRRLRDGVVLDHQERKASELEQRARLIEAQQRERADRGRREAQAIRQRHQPWLRLQNQRREQALQTANERMARAWSELREKAEERARRAEANAHARMMERQIRMEEKRKREESRLLRQQDEAVRRENYQQKLQRIFQAKQLQAELRLRERAGPRKHPSDT
jgi:hypothetical protein